MCLIDRVEWIQRYVHVFWNPESGSWKRSEFNLAIIEIDRDWPRSKNDKVIVELKKYFVEQYFNNWVHSV